ncbi:MAG: UXX-star selenoprotein family 1 [Nitrospinales bacterium]|jgi:glutaredoxin
MPNYIIFGKNDCPHTQKARKDFKRKCIPFAYVNVETDPHGLEKMLEYSNDKYVVPVIVEVDEDNVQIGYTD